MSTQTPDKPKKALVIHRDKLTEIGSFIMEGLSEEEACVMAGFSPAGFKELKQSNEKIAMFLQKKSIEFKRKHLQRISSKPSDKTSMWMLENLRPEEFGSKKKGGDAPANVIGLIIKDIRQSNDALPVNIQDAEYTTKSADGRELDVKSVLV